MQNIGIQDFTIGFVQGLPGLRFERWLELPTVPGLYFVLIENPDPAVIYIGETQDLLGRWSCHNLVENIEFLLLIGIRVTIKYLHIDWSEEDRKTLELVAIRRLRPVLNVVHRQRPKIQKPEEVTEGTVEAVAVAITKPLEMMSRAEILGVASALDLSIPARTPITDIVFGIKESLGSSYAYCHPGRKSHLSREDVEGIKNLVLSDSPDGTILGSLQRMTLRQLKPIASRLKIYRYSHMATAEIIREIVSVIESFDDNNDLDL